MTTEELYEGMIKTGEEWANLNHAAELLEESKRSVRAQYAIEHLATGGAVAKAELRADSDSRYREHLSAMSLARKKANIARVHYDAAKALIDLTRSQLATERAALQLR